MSEQSEQRARKMIGILARFFAVMFFLVIILDFITNGLNTLMGYAIPLFFLQLLNLVASFTSKN
jgi:hypothetical protein